MKNLANTSRSNSSGIGGGKVNDDSFLLDLTEDDKEREENLAIQTFQDLMKRAQISLAKKEQQKDV